MSCISWNCRGLANPRAIRILTDLVRDRRPSIVFLIETISEVDKVERLTSTLGFEHCFVVPRRGHSGGLALYWKDSIEVSIIGSSDHHIDCCITLDSEEPFRWTDFYGYANRAQRHLSWSLLRDLHSQSNLPWVISGEFNKLLNATEKRGNSSHPSYLMHQFCQVLEDLSLQDLGFVGPRFTWERGRGTYRWVEERLDRVVASRDWVLRFNAAKVYHISYTSSDHIPLFLEIRKFVVRSSIKQFRFENHWMLERNCGAIVREGWLLGASLDIQGRLTECGRRLLQWSRNQLGELKERIKQQKFKVQQYRSGRDAASVKSYKEAETNLFRLLHQEEVYWQQRAKLFWLQDGDENTTAFHLFANGRRRKKSLSGLQDSNGQWLEVGKGLEKHVHDYFSELFQSQGAFGSQIGGVVEQRVTSEHNVELLKPLTAEEIKVAAFSMHADKAPDEDGFNPGFYKKFWSVETTRLDYH